MSETKLKLVVDNALLVPIQPFDPPIFIDRIELEEMRKGFDEWMNCPLCEMGIPLKRGNYVQNDDN